jgi:hypothetical protein
MKLVAENIDSDRCDQKDHRRAIKGTFVLAFSPWVFQRSETDYFRFRNF